MKWRIVSILLFVFASAMGGCGKSTTSNPTPEPLVIADQTSLLKALQAAGATVEGGDSVIQDFFSPEGSLVQANGVDIQVFEYESPEVMEQEASQVAPDGSSVGTSMMMWVDAPHFYKTGRIITLYLGKDENTLNLLRQVIGDQFAGQ